MSEATTKPKKRRGRPPKKAKVEEAPVKTTTENDASEIPDDFVKSTSIKASGVIRIEPETLREEPQYSIWMGTTEECPYWTVHAGGSDFPRFNEIIQFSEDGGVTHRERVLGKTLDMTRTDIELVAKAVGRKVVRKDGARAFVLNADSERYRHKPTDQPLGKFLYMKVIDGNLPHNWRAGTPETMV